MKLTALLARYRAWRVRRYWAKRHLDFMRAMVSTDLRWLSVDKRGEILLERYEKMLSPDWYKHQFEDIGDLRKRLGWCPHDKRKGSQQTGT